MKKDAKAPAKNSSAEDITRAEQAPQDINKLQQEAEKERTKKAGSQSNSSASHRKGSRGQSK